MGSREEVKSKSSSGDGVGVGGRVLSALGKAAFLSSTLCQSTLTLSKSRDDIMTYSCVLLPGIYLLIVLFFGEESCKRSEKVITIVSSTCHFPALNPRRLTASSLKPFFIWLPQD